MAATFSSALAYALSMCWKTRSSLERQAAGGVEVSVRWGVYVGTVPTGYGKS